MTTADSGHSSQPARHRQEPEGFSQDVDYSCELAPSCTVNMNYLGEMAARPTFNVYDRTRHNLNLVTYPINIKNARTLTLPPSLDREGFCVVRHCTAVSDLEHRKAVLQVYRVEIQALIRELTGAYLVVSESLGVVRSAQRTRGDGRTTHAPIRFVHADYSHSSAQDLLHRLLHPEDARSMGGRRFVVFNAWRALTPPPQDVPLALCDLRTVSRSDCMTADSVFDFPGSRPGKLEVSLFRFSDAHDWVYWPNMTGDELLIFKAFDSGLEGPSQVPHCAFDDPNCESPSTPRVSLDIRAIAVF
jgi:hypothetical protein